MILILLVTTLLTPTYLVEKIGVNHDVSVRVTVFRDRVAVLARREGGGEAEVTRVRLDEVEYAVILQVVEECYGELAARPGATGVLGGPVTEVRLAPPAKPVLVVRWADNAVRTLAAGRLEKALDELQRRIEQTPPGAEDLSEWEPAVGDRVVLVDGREGRVAAFLAAMGGCLVQLDLGPASEYYPLDELRRKVVRRLPR